MNESIKDRFLKEHALNDDDLEKVAGGAVDYSVGAGQGLCQNPACSHFNDCVMVYLSYDGFYLCSYCNTSIPNELVDPHP